MRQTEIVQQIELAESRALHYSLRAQKLRLELQVRRDVAMKRGPYWRKRYSIQRAKARWVRIEEVAAGARMAAWAEAIDG
jgi:hypothetical protein